MNLSKHALLLGKLLGNLQSLEFGLRAVLYKPESNDTDVWVKLDQMKVGDVVSENALTNFDTLSKLIVKYNKQFTNGDPKQFIDSTIVDIRNALAHGRISTSSQTKPMRLLKFSLPKDKKVIVDFAEEMNEEWFTLSNKRVKKELKKLLPHLK